MQHPRWIYRCRPQTILKAPWRLLPSQRLSNLRQSNLPSNKFQIWRKRQRMCNLKALTSTRCSFSTKISFTLSDLALLLPLKNIFGNSMTLNQVLMNRVQNGSLNVSRTNMRLTLSLLNRNIEHPIPNLNRHRRSKRSQSVRRLWLKLPRLARNHKMNPYPKLRPLTLSTPSNSNERLTRSRLLSYPSSEQPTTSHCAPLTTWLPGTTDTHQPTVYHHLSVQTYSTPTLFPRLTLNPVSSNLTYHKLFFFAPISISPLSHFLSCHSTSATNDFENFSRIGFCRSTQDGELFPRFQDCAPKVRFGLFSGIGFAHQQSGSDTWLKKHFATFQQN